MRPILNLSKGDKMILRVNRSPKVLHQRTRCLMRESIQQSIQFGCGDEPHAISLKGKKMGGV